MLIYFTYKYQPVWHTDWPYLACMRKGVLRTMYPMERAGPWLVSKVEEWDVSQVVSRYSSMTKRHSLF